MGRKSKNRGKSKRGGKQRSPGTNTAEAVSPPLNTMQLLENGMAVLRGGKKLEQALELKAQRDEFEEELKSLSQKDLEEVDEVHLKLSHLLNATTTLQMAQCGLVEEEKHSSIVYAEEHADVLFDDGGAKFFTMWKEAAGKAALEQQKRKEMERAIKDGDIDGQMLVLKDLMETMDVAQNDSRIEQGLPPIQFESHFHNTKLDDELFQPCPPKPDCPICFLPMPSRDQCCYQPCCGKCLCDGCIFAHRDAKNDLGMANSCPFCRDPVANTEEERFKKTEKRLKHGDREAFYMLGACYYNGAGTLSLKQNRKKGLELMNQAAELGLEMAHHSLGMAYAYGDEGEKNEKKALYHFRLAAIGGLLEARHILGQSWLQRDPNMAYKHFLIAAEAGYDESLKEIKTGYAEGHVEKDVFEKALRAHKAAKDEVKREPRDKAAEWYRRHGPS
eukprot:scaffold15643_cov117-Skeletonema_marinoi.AAC.3